jgi:hypothetical protein
MVKSTGPLLGQGSHLKAKVVHKFSHFDIFNPTHKISKLKICVVEV